MLSNFLLLAGLAAAQTGVPDYFISTPEIFAGPTPTGKPAFLAQTNPAPFAGVSYIPNEPLETQVPISGANGRNIYHLHGQLSHYFPGPGFGVAEYPLPAGANITQLYMLSRHGSRYPTTGTPTVIQRFTNNTGKYKATGKLAFLNGWTNKLGEEILVPVGKQELFDSGVLHQYNYGHLYKQGTKIIARSTTQDRMRQSAEYFMAGFFGLQWPQNATIEFIIEQNGFNDTLAGYYRCNNSNNFRSTGGSNASTTWQNIYLANAQKRLQPQITGLNLSISDVYGMQSLCAYETVALGYSAFCDLFTYEEWEGYEYSVDLSFSGNNGFQSPTGRAVGTGWVEEFRARLTHHYLTSPVGQINTTLDNNAVTFPLNQSLYFDFSHDTNIFSDITALGLKQFSTFLPADRILRNRSTVISHLTPFGARIDFEIITAPSPVPARRGGGSGAGAGSGKGGASASSSVRRVTSVPASKAPTVVVPTAPKATVGAPTPAKSVGGACPIKGQNCTGPHYTPSSGRLVAPTPKHGSTLSTARITSSGRVGGSSSAARPSTVGIPSTVPTRVSSRASGSVTGSAKPTSAKARRAVVEEDETMYEERDSIHDYHLAGRDLEIAREFEELHARQVAAGAATQYIHILISQRTVPLHANYPQCVYRDDGWCELGAFLKAIENQYALSDYNYACNGNYSAQPYGKITNGAPLR